MISRQTPFTFAIFAGCLSCAPIALARPEPVVKVVAGRLAGVAAKSKNVEVFRGIAFAAPPIGALRWKPPQPAPAWQGTRIAANFGPVCMQGPDASEHPAQPRSEDCLYLNIWRPRKATAKKPLPVFVWIPGGAFVAGAGSLNMYEGSQLALCGLIVVTINYRVGPFGFLAHPDLTAESGTSGNYGLMDQIAALRWVQANIGAFGGDPARVTIGGHSAGGVSTADLMVAPAAKGLFRGAIVQSGPPTGITPPPRPRVEAEEIGAAYLRLRGASNIAAARNLPADVVLKARPDDLRFTFPFTPIIDGEILPASPADLFEHGQSAPIPLLIGAASGESGAFVREKPTPQSFAAFAFSRHGEEAGKVLHAYPHATDVDVQASQRELMSDQLWAASQAYAACHARAGNPAWIYLYDHPHPGPFGATQGAFHGAELVYVFGTLDSLDLPWTDADRRFSRVLGDIWASFIRTGNPNGPGLPVWPAYTRGVTPRLSAVGIDDARVLHRDTARRDLFFPDFDPHPRPLGTRGATTGC